MISSQTLIEFKMKKTIMLILFVVFSSHSFAEKIINKEDTASQKIKIVKDNHQFYESIHKYDNDWANQNNG